MKASFLRHRHHSNFDALVCTEAGIMALICSIFCDMLLGFLLALSPPPPPCQLVCKIAPREGGGVELLVHYEDERELLSEPR